MFFGQDVFMMPFERFDPPDLVTVEDFKCDPKGVVKKVTEWSAKAAERLYWLVIHRESPR
jgi:hypothetical protein